MKERLFGKIVYLLYRLIGLTYRFREINPEVFTQTKTLHPSGNYIFAIWHNNIFASILSQISIPHVTMASRSKDGEIIASALHAMKYVAARGSSSKGGRKALDDMIAILNTPNNPYPAALTVDGPRGPIYEVKRGVFDLAHATGLPILPYTVLAENYWEMRSWDKFRIPKPFSRIWAYYSDPILADSADTDQMETNCQKLKTSLMEGEAFIKRHIQNKRLSISSTT